MIIIRVGDKAPDFEGHGWFVDGQTEQEPERHGGGQCPEERVG